ncbi:MAG: sugar phosphate isomerase/epimerase [Planctomycetia bacterium]|nr:sugar phosphate isomerase/epimerase [Planctomycetia bacterium]
MRLGHGTNSIGDVAPRAALPLLCDLGYRSLALTLDHHLLDPFSADLPTEVDRWRGALRDAGMACVVETGARHLLDPLVKHEPTLVSADPAARQRRIDFLVRAIDIAAALDAGCVSAWAGVVRDAAPGDVVWHRLTTALGPVLEHAAHRGVPLAFEPEPGMFIDTLDRFGILVDRLRDPPGLRLCLDTGHLECMGEWPPAEHLAPWVERVANVHVDDAFPCVHEHLPLGSGSVDFGAILGCLAAGGYAGGLHVELPRHTHRWIEEARHSAAFLRRLLGTAAG